MKSSRGFISIPLLVVISIFILGVGIFYFNIRLEPGHTSVPVFKGVKLPFVVIPPEMGGCYAMKDHKEFRKIIINTEKELDDLLAVIAQLENGNCLTIQKPIIDFEKQTVLGAYAVGSCGAYSFEKTVSRSDEDKTIFYGLAEQDHFCHSGPGRSFLNLIAIPKIPSGYTVSIEIAYPARGTIEVKPIDCFSKAELKLYEDNHIGVGAPSAVKICPE